MKSLLIWAIMAISIRSLCGQTLISFSGGVIENENLSMSFSLGEIATQTISINQATFQQGLQQNQSSTINQPKPHYFTFNYQTETSLYYTIPDTIQYKVSIVSITGQVLSESLLEGQPINISNLKQGEYMLMVYANNTLEGSYKFLVFEH